MKKKSPTKPDEGFLGKHFPCIITGAMILVMMFSYLFSGFVVRVVCITVAVFTLTVYTAPLVRKVRAVLFATAGFVCSFHHELSIQQSERELFPEVDGGAWITAEYPDLGKIRTDRILSGCGSSPEYYLVYLESMEICK